MTIAEKRRFMQHEIVELVTDLELLKDSDSDRERIVWARLMEMRSADIRSLAQQLVDSEGSEKHGREMADTQ